MIAGLAGGLLLLQRRAGPFEAVARGSVVGREPLHRGERLAGADARRRAAVDASRCGSCCSG